MLDYVGEKTCRSHGAEDFGIGEVVCFLEVIEHGGEYARGTTCGGGDDVSTGGIALGGGQGIGNDEGTALEAGLVGGGTYVVLTGFAAQMKTARDDTFGLESGTDGFLHDVPHVLEVIPDVGGLALLHVFPVVHAFMFDIRQNLGEGGHIINVLFRDACGFVGKGTATDAIDGPVASGVAVRVEGLEMHSVGMERKNDIRFPDYVDGYGGCAFEERFVGMVTAAGGGKTAIEGDADGVGVGMVGLEL